MTSGGRVVSDRRYTFAVDPEQFWTLIADVDSYREWWPWLRSFDARGLDPGRTLAVHRATSLAVPGPLHRDARRDRRVELDLLDDHR